jgi:hypothetical protein
MPDPLPGRIDKSLLAIAEPKRLRDKAHLKFVASQPCLIYAFVVKVLKAVNLEERYVYVCKSRRT